jgi:antibiotic biosynthesis monooxygenase
MRFSHNAKLGRGSSCCLGREEPPWRDACSSELREEVSSWQSSTSATNTMRHLPGFVSASIHKSVDNTRVVNYAQWRTKDDFDAMRTNPEAIPHMKAAAALASFDPIACEVAESIAR